MTVPERFETQEKYVQLGVINMLGWLVTRRRLVTLTLACFLPCLINIAAAQSLDNDPAPSRIIIKWKEHKSRSHEQSIDATSQALHKSMGLGLRQRRGISETMDGMQLTTPLNRKDFEKALARLNHYPDVEFAVEDKRRFAHALPNDPLITATSGRTGQWYLNDPAANSQWISAINAVSAWNFSTGGIAGSGVIVAVVDTGIRADHPDLAGKLLSGRDFIECDQLPCTGSTLTYLTSNDGDGWDADPSDPGDSITQTMIDANPAIFKNCTAQASSSWHGTRVAGIIGAATNNGIGIAGIGYNARILPIRALGRCGGYDSDIIAGMRWAAGLTVQGIPVNPNPAKIINLSLGGGEVCSATAYPTAVTELLNDGVTIVASAGNEGAATDAPANCAGVIGVAGLRNAGTKVGFSSLGSEISIAAPAGNCVNTSGACLFSIDTTTNLGTTTPGTNDYTDQSNANLGTSFSAPIVSGTVALMVAANPTLTPQAILARLQANARPFPATATATCHVPASFNEFQTSECNCTTRTCGAGMTNASASVQNASTPIVPYIRGGNVMRANGSLTLDATGSTLSDNTATYTWSLQSGTAVLSSGTGPKITITASATPGTIGLLLTVDDGQGHNATKTHSITVYGAPIALIAGSSTVAASQSISLDGSGSSAQDGGALFYGWTVTGGSGTLSNTSNAVTTFTAPATPGTSTVTLAVTDQEGSIVTASTQITITGGTSSSSSSSASSVSSSSSSVSSSSVASSSSSSLTITGARSGGGAMQWQWLICFASLIMMMRRSRESGMNADLQC